MTQRKLQAKKGPDTFSGLNDFLVKIAEDGIEKVIESGGEYLPTNRDRWACRKV